MKAKPKDQGAPSDEQLVVRSLRGDVQAFGDLYERYLEAIYRYLYHRVEQASLAEDLTEMVFLKVWEALPQFRPKKAPFRVWLYRVAHNLLVDHYRMQKGEARLEAIAGLTDGSPRPEEQVIAAEDRDRVLAALHRLPADYREVLTLRFIDGLSHAETARAMKRSPGAVRVLQHRALRALAQLLGEGNAAKDG